MSSFKKREFLKINVCISKIYLDFFPQSRNSDLMAWFYKREYLEADRAPLSEVLLLGLLRQASHPLWFFCIHSEYSQSKILVVFVLLNDVAGA